MHSIRKYLSVILMISCFLSASKKSFAQNSDAKFNLDSSKTITLAEFNHRVDKAAELLKTKELSAIQDSDHINIMMCLNTIFMVHPKGSIEQTFKGGRYTQLEMIARKKRYEFDIVKVYPGYIFNRGMGFYFPQLKMELYGTPHLYAIFNVLE